MWPIRPAGGTMTAAKRATREQLRQENQELRAQVAALEQTVRDLRDQNQRLQQQLDEQTRAAARPTAPFRRRDSQKVPEDSRKRPGRPPGHPGARRAIPDHVDEHAEVPLMGCPHCGAPVTAVEAIEQFIEEIPPVRPHVTRLVTYRGRCATCGPVPSSHPLQTSTATGAAKIQLGPRAHALAAALNKQFGLTMRKTCRVLQHTGGLSLSPGGLAQAVQRTAAKVTPAFDRLVTEVRAAAAVFVDETSWYVGAPGSWLWTFTTADATLYHVDPSRGRQVVLEMLGADFAGILVSDCLASYENLPWVRPGNHVERAELVDYPAGSVAVRPVTLEPTPWPPPSSDAPTPASPSSSRSPTRTPCSTPKRPSRTH